MSSPGVGQKKSPLPSASPPALSPIGKSFERLILAPREDDRPQYDPDKDEVDSQDGDEVSDDMTSLPVQKVGPMARKKPVALFSENTLASGESESTDKDEADDEELDEEEFEDEVPEAQDMVATEDGGNKDSGEDDHIDAIHLAIDWEHAGCSDDYRYGVQQTLENLKDKTLDYKKQIHDLRDTVRRLTVDSRGKDLKLAEQVRELGELRNAQVQAQQQAQRPCRQRITKRTWPHQLLLYLTGDANAMSYKEVYKLCCREENMSVKMDVVHPNLRLRGPSPREIEKELVNEMPNFTSGSGTADGQADDESLSMGSLRDQSPSNVSEELLVPGNGHLGGRRRSQGLNSFHFKDLPFNIQANILKFVFLQEDKFIHCISRLDPYMPPDEQVRFNAKQSGLPHRFHILGASCNISYAIKPDEHLALFSVCKNWYFIGIHVFYGLNTFAFSSIGEFAGFCRGIGQPRRERIQHVDLLWTGNQCRPYPFQHQGKSRQSKYTSRRTWDCSLLCEMPRLKSLTIHINETGSDFMRRRHEPTHIKDFMAVKTAGQPNFRLTRSLRTLQGLDYIHQLRGMEVIRFFDFEMHLKLGGRHPIRDWTFSQDVKNVTTLPKAAEKAEEAKLKNLQPVTPGLNIQDSHWDVIEGLYHSSSAFDTDGHPRQEVRRAQILSPFRMETIQEEDVEIPDIKSINQGPKTTGPSRKRAMTEDACSDSATSDRESTPRASALYARSATIESTSGSKDFSDDDVVLAGSTQNNPINLDEYRPKTLRLVSEVNEFKRAHSTASSNGLFVRQNSYDGHTRTPMRPIRSWSITSRIHSSTPSHGREVSRDLGADGLYNPTVSPEAPVEQLRRLIALAGSSGTDAGTNERAGKRGYEDECKSNTGAPAHISHLRESPSFSHVSSRPSFYRLLPHSAHHFMYSAPSMSRSQQSRLSSAEDEPNPFKKPRKQ